MSLTFTELSIQDAYLVQVDPVEDERGIFARAWDKQAFDEQGLQSDYVQANISQTDLKGTIRGLHYQEPPYEEAKLLRCTRGEIWDVMVDLRRSSPTFLQWEGVRISALQYHMVYIPEGCAHGFQTLRDDSEVFYFTSATYAPNAEMGIRYDDPSIGIRWPVSITRVSEKDRSWPDYTR